MTTKAKQPPAAALAWAASQLGEGARVVSAEGLREGGNPWLLRIDDHGRTAAAVLKTARAGANQFTTEVAALRLAAEYGIPAPRILGVDPDGYATGTPAVLETVVPGRSAIPREPLPERLHGMGAAAAVLYAVPVEPSPALPVRTRPIPVDDFARDRREGADHPTPLLLAADERVRRLPTPDGEFGFVHGDLWQGNMAWDGGAFTGLLDWEMAGVGHYGVDLSSVRLDAALMFGQDAAGPVLAGWEQATGERAAGLAYWDAVAALNLPGDMAAFAPAIHDQGRTDLSPATLNERRDAFLRSALDRLPGRG